MKEEIVLKKKVNEAIGEFLKTKEKNLQKLWLIKKDIILLTLSFLLGRVSLMGDIMPFGTAVFAASMDLCFSRLLLAAMVLMGMFTAGAGDQIYLSAASMAIIYFIRLPLKRSLANQNFKDSTIAFIGVLIPHLVMASMQGMLLYDLLKAMMESFIVFALVYAIKNAMPFISEQEYKPRIYTNEEIISIAILTALALAGLGDMSVFGLTVKNVSSILIIIMFSFKCGTGVGAATGVTVGIITSMSNTMTPLVIGTYAFCGLLAGILRKLGRIGSCLGFVLGNAVLTLYMNGSVEVLVHLKEIIAAIVIFLATPGRIINSVTGRLGSNSDISLLKDNYSLRIKEMTVQKLKKFSKAFNELAKTFNEISETKVVTNNNDISSLFDRVAEQVCKDCSVCQHCWDRNFYNTYQVMFKIVEKLDSKGRIEKEDIPEYFLSRCERINDFVKSVNAIYELFKVDMVWKSKIGESRGLVSQQLQGLSNVISNLASEIDVNVRFKGELEGSILLELNKAGIKTREVIAVENKFGKFEISIFHKGCNGKRSCRTVIEEMVSVLAGRSMVKEENDCYYNASSGICCLRLVEEEEFKVTTGIARVSKNQNSVSGDNYTFMNTGEGKYIVALSDGMGSGQKASTQSKATINLLEQFMEAGFDKDTTVKLINSILVLRADDDSFATIDMSVVDLFDGRVEFVKIGAAPAFIKRKSGVEIVKSISLPAGILSNVDIDLVGKKVESGDFVIMLTDGTLDAFNNDEEDSSKVLQRTIQEITSTNPQEIADKILDKAYSNCEGTPVDDMTVLAAKVWKRVK